MKTLLFTLILATLTMATYTQNFYSSNSHVKTLEGSIIALNEIFEDSEGTILIFWEMNNPECYNNLENLNEAWLEKVRGLNVDLISICIDRQGNWSRVKPYVAGKGWEFDTYVDSNGELRRMLGITNMPHTVLLDKDQNVKCSYAGYCSGDELNVCEKIITCLEKTGDLANL